ncbi:MAG: single-stranded-DNA-specific exonuclease RecJ [Pseudomonadota bacterium]
MAFDSFDPSWPLLLGVENSVTGRSWRQRDVCRRTADLAVQRFGLDSLLAQVILSRGVALEELEAHLSPSLKNHLPDPSILMEMDKAAARLADALTRGETIGIFGDYDVDGTVSAALLYRYLRSVGAAPAVHLPDRFTEGYGPSREGLRALEERGVSLICTVDCGSNHGDILSATGADVVVLDHHLMTERPEVYALINPHRPGDRSGLGGLSAGGVTFMTLVALNRELRTRGFFTARPEPRLTRYLDLVAVSLICDVMPLQGLTRLLVAQGLKVMGDVEHGQLGNPGLKALALAAGLQGQVGASQIGFQIGPRINAAGRIGHAKIAFDLLTTDEPSQAAAIAQKLEALNKERRRLEDHVRREAIAQIEARGLAGSEPIVAAGEGWHPGVVGIVAGRLKERFHRPAFCISLEGEKGTGSGRSVDGIDLGAAVSDAAAQGVIQAGGGHAMAAGLSLSPGQVDGFRHFLETRLSASVAEATAQRPLVVDGVVGLGAVTAATCRTLGPAGPFGQGNPEPRFALSDVRVRHARLVGERHLSITVEDNLGKTARGIAFGVKDEPLGALLENDRRPLIHLAGRITPDTWRGGEAAQFEVDDASGA